MTDVTFASGAAAQIGSYVRAGKAAGFICDGYVATLRLFDKMCAERFPGAAGLTQEMADAWCERRPTEQANTCRARCWPVVSLVGFLRSRGETDVVAPELPRKAGTGYAPHHFTDVELSLFFEACDSYRPKKGPEADIERNARTIPVIFRLLYSSGIRVGEARMLRRENADLESGVLRIVEGKGRNERLVALHPSMTELMRRYDGVMEAAFPNRTYFFPNGRGDHLTNNWICRYFRILWRKVSDEAATAYHLRHEYAIRNIDGMAAAGVAGLMELEYLSKSMGHGSVDMTVEAYYHITPSLAKVLQERCGEAFDDVIPGVVRR